MLAPDLLLIGPGAVLSLVGVLMLAVSFVSPEGIEIGSLLWQPTFFSGIALILGFQAMLAGVVLAPRVVGHALGRLPTVRLRRAPGVLAQSLIVVGGTLVTFSIVSHFRLRQAS